MTELFAFILGFALCLALCRKRIRESRRAFNAACELLDVAHEKIEKLQKTLSNVRGLAERIKSNRHLDLGGRAMLPAAAESTGQRISIPLSSDIAGLPGGRPHFLGREQ